MFLCNSSSVLEASCYILHQYICFIFQSYMWGLSFSFLSNICHIYSQILFVRIGNQGILKMNGNEMEGTSLQRKFPGWMSVQRERRATEEKKVIGYWLLFRQEIYFECGCAASHPIAFKLQVIVQEEKLSVIV